MSNIKDVGGFKDHSGREIRVALFSEKYPPYSFQVWIKKNYSPWVKQEGVSVQNSEKALSWAKEQIASERIF